MMLLRFIVLAGVLVALGVYAPTRANAATPGAVAALSAVHSDAVEQKKAETPPRPRPKPGPKDGGEDE